MFFISKLLKRVLFLFLRAFITKNLKILTFNNWKYYFIYFNTPIYNTPNIKGVFFFFFLPLYLNILFFIHHLFLILSLPIRLSLLILEAITTRTTTYHHCQQNQPSQTMTNNSSSQNKNSTSQPYHTNPMTHQKPTTHITTTTNLHPYQQWQTKTIMFTKRTRPTLSRLLRQLSKAHECKKVL